MINLTNELIKSLSVGSAFLSTGGGGSPYLGLLMAQQTILEGYKPTLVSLHKLPKTAKIVCIGGMGAPEIAYEKIPATKEGVMAFNKMQDFLGCKIDALLPLEVAGLNALYPLCIAARLGIPVVDADGMGRAFPKIDMTTFNAYGNFGSPTLLANERGETVIFDKVENMAKIEDYARALTIKMGGSIFFASYLMDVETAHAVTIPGTFSLAIELGNKMQEARKNQKSVLRAACECLNSSMYGRAEELFAGKIVDLQRSSQTGFTIGKAIIEGINENPGSVELFFQNEYYLVTQNGHPLIMTPDLICIVDHESHEPINTEALRYGQRISIIGVRAPEILKGEALKLLGPKNFGLDIAYQPF